MIIREKIVNTAARLTVNLKMITFSIYILQSNADILPIVNIVMQMYKFLNYSNIIWTVVGLKMNLKTVITVLIQFKLIVKVLIIRNV
jgi:hypothetical protein